MPDVVDCRWERLLIMIVQCTGKSAMRMIAAFFKMTCRILSWTKKWQLNLKCTSSSRESLWNVRTIGWMYYFVESFRVFRGCELLWFIDHSNGHNIMTQSLSKQIMYWTFYNVPCMDARNNQDKSLFSPCLAISGILWTRLVLKRSEWVQQRAARWITAKWDEDNFKWSKSYAVEITTTKETYLSPYEA